MYVFLSAWLTCFFILAFGPAAQGLVENTTTGVLEVELTFPRNDTHAPQPLFPVVISLKNFEVAKVLNAHLECKVRRYDQVSGNYTYATWTLKWANFSSSDPYFLYRGFNDYLNTKGSWLMTWYMRWTSCLEDGPQEFDNSPYLYANESGGAIAFTTKNLSQKADLVAMTKDQTCPDTSGFAINVTDTLEVPAGQRWDDASVCAVMATITPTPTSCQVQINAEVASSISSSMTSRASNSLNPAISCPAADDDDDESTAVQARAAGGMVGLAAAFGGLGYIL